MTRSARLSLVLHADDFGMNRAITDGIIKGFREGILTSTSLLANGPDLRRAASEWKKLEGDRQSGHLLSASKRAVLSDSYSPFDLGVHLNLTQGIPLRGDFPDELRDDGGRFLSIGSLTAKLLMRPTRFVSAIRAELRDQVSRVVDLGCRPTHVNGHQYIEMLAPVRQALNPLLPLFGIDIVRRPREPGVLFGRSGVRGPVSWTIAFIKQSFSSTMQRDLEARRFRFTESYFGTMLAGRVTLRHLERFILRSRPSSVVEVGLHPAIAVTRPSRWDEPWHDPLYASRPSELSWLISDQAVDVLVKHACHLTRLSSLSSEGVAA